MLYSQRPVDSFMTRWVSESKSTGKLRGFTLSSFQGGWYFLTFYNRGGHKCCNIKLPPLILSVFLVLFLSKLVSWSNVMALPSWIHWAAVFTWKVHLSAIINKAKKKERSDDDVTSCHPSFLYPEGGAFIAGRNGLHLENQCLGLLC